MISCALAHEHLFNVVRVGPQTPLFGIIHGLTLSFILFFIIEFVYVHVHLCLKRSKMLFSRGKVILLYKLDCLQRNLKLVHVYTKNSKFD